MKTVIISDPKVTIVEGSYAEILQKHSNQPIDASKGNSKTYGEVRKELIKARKFQRMTNGQIETYLIGFDEHTCQLLEILPTRELWELNRSRLHAHEQRLLIDGYRGKLKDIKNATFWTKLKWLFCKPTF